MDDVYNNLEKGKIRICINDLVLESLVGVLYFADDSVTDSSMWKMLDQHTSTEEDRIGRYKQLTVIYQTTHNLNVETVYKSYHEQPLLSVQVKVNNVGKSDLFLAKIGILRCEPPDGGLDVGFSELSECKILDQVFCWTGHRALYDYLRPLAKEKYYSYWGSLVADTCGRTLTVGIGDHATGRTEIWLREVDGKLGLEINSALSSSLDGQRKLRIPPNGSHTTEPIMLVWGDDPWQALVDYADFTSQLLDLQLKPPYSGIFSAYGSDPENNAPEKIPLTEKRIEELIAVVDEYLKPYGLDTIKTQFRGLSSSGFEQKIGADEAQTPVSDQLISTIREKGWSGDGISEDYPHGIPWHIEQLKLKGYRPALVCRPFLNIKAGTPELDQTAADLFEMTVKEWGYQYLMLDFNSADYESEVDTITVEEGFYRRFKAIRDRVGTDIFIEACMIWPGPVLGVADGFRPGHDWRGGLEHELMQAFASRYHYHGRFFQLDNEFFDPALHPFTWGEQGIEGIQASLDRVRMWVSFCGLLGMSYLGGAAMEKVSPERWHLFQRAIPVVDGSAKPLDLMESNPPQRWRRDVNTPAGSFSILGLFNYDEKRPVKKVVRPSEWGLDDNTEYLFFDFWTERVYGPTYDLPLTLEPFSCHILFVQPIPRQPIFIGSTRHVAGKTGLDEWCFNQETGELRIKVSGAQNSHERYYIWLPDNEGVTECIGADFEVERPRLIRLGVNFNSSNYKEVLLKLNKGIPVL
jgi:hypothetical protein